MSATKPSIPGFKIDPVTGKYVPVPVDFSVLFPHTTKRANQEWTNSRKCNDTHSIQPTKFRKTETGVRKELFKPPIINNARQKDLPTKDMKSRQPGVRKSLIKCLPTKNDSKRPGPKKSDPNESSHMISIKEEFEQVEEPINFKSPIISAPPRGDEVKTPDYFESNANFLRLEQLCQSPRITNESPVSSVCNMIENNMILNSEKKNSSNQPLSQKEVILEIRRAVEVNQDLYQKTASKIKEVLELQIRQEENFRKITQLVDKLENDSKGCSVKSETDEEKENSAIKRRSLRLQNKSPTNDLGRPAGSPVILKSGDLRKSTLTKTLAAKCQKLQIDNPRIQKAMDMYNSTRSNCNALLTPKISRVDLAASPLSLNWRANLSYKVQEQCLLLQDTPVHK